MKNENVKFILCILFFVVLAAITFRCVFGADMVFSASDLNIGRLAFKKNNLPEMLTGYFTANQVMGSSGYGCSLFNVMLWLLPLTFFANAYYGILLILGSSSLVAFLRLRGVRWMSAVAGALMAFWFNSIMLAAGGHAYKMEVLALTALSLYLIEKAVCAERLRSSAGFSILVGLTVGLMMISQQDVALLAGLVIGPYALFRLFRQHKTTAVRWVGVLMPIAIVALALSGTTVLKSFKSNIQGAASVQGDPQEKWNFITQWSMVPEEWPDLIASGWGGWATGRQDGPYWGSMGQSAEWKNSGGGFRNFKLTSKYIGIIPFMLALYGFSVAVRKRREVDFSAPVFFWFAAAVVALALSYGKFSLLYKLFYQLPLLGDIRDQSKMLDLFQLCLGVTAAFGLDRLWSEEDGRGHKKAGWMVGAVAAGLMLAAGLRHAAMPAGQIQVFSEMGFGPLAEVMVRNMSNAWFHAGLLTLLCSGIIFAAWKKVSVAKWVVPLVVLALAVDSLVLTSHYFKATDIAALKRGNVVVDFLKTHQGNERTNFMDQNGIYNQWLAADGPFHDLNLFNIWQMPRMPVEYKEYLGKVGKNQIRLWELSSIKYVAAPAGIMEQLKQNPQLGQRFKPVLNYKVPTAQGMRQDVVLEFSGSVPRLALYEGWKSLPLEQHCTVLAEPQHSFSSTLLVDASAELPASGSSGTFTALDGVISKKSATVKVSTEKQTMVRFSQRFVPGWHVRVNGKPAELIRVDYLCMGVVVPAGEHTVEFRCVDGSRQVFFSGIVLLLSLVGASVLLRKGNRAE